MGCLTFTARPLFVDDVQISAESRNDLSMTVQNLNYGADVTATMLNSIPVISAQSKNVKVKITAGLICGVDLDTYEFLYVDEGPLIVENGYLKVRKKHT